MAANYFTGPDMNAAAAYELAQQDSALRRSALTNQLLSDNWRNANASQLGNRSLDVDLSRQRAMSEMAANELANRVALADKADTLARYRWGTPSADVTTQDKTRREIAQMEAEATRNALAAQVGLGYQGLEAQREANDRASKLDRAKLALQLAMTSPVDDATAALRQGQATADATRAAALNSGMYDRFGKTHRLLNWLGAWTIGPQDKLDEAVASGKLAVVTDPNTKKVVGYRPIGEAEGLGVNQLTGEFFANQPSYVQQPRVPGLMNQLLPMLGLVPPAPTTSNTEAAPNGVQLPSGAFRFLGPEALNQKRQQQGQWQGPVGFVPAPASMPAPATTPNPLALQLEMIRAGNAGQMLPQATSYTQALSNYLLNQAGQR